MKITQPSSIRLTIEGKRLLRALAEANGLSMSAMLETLIRAQAKRENMK